MAKLIATIKAVITRVLFGTHGFIAIWQVARNKEDPVYWYLCVPIGLLVVEGLFTLAIKKNQEWRWYVCVFVRPPNALSGRPDAIT